MTKTNASHTENGIEICNTCVRPAATPYRYTNSKGEVRGCVSICHDVHVRWNSKPNWREARYVLPKWITEARAVIRKQAQANGLSSCEF